MLFIKSNTLKADIKANLIHSINKVIVLFGWVFGTDVVLNGCCTVQKMANAIHHSGFLVAGVSGPGVIHAKKRSQ
jgi:hypothetical protein